MRNTTDAKGYPFQRSTNGGLTKLVRLSKQTNAILLFADICLDSHRPAPLFFNLSHNLHTVGMNSGSGKQNKVKEEELSERGEEL